MSAFVAKMNCYKTLQNKISISSRFSYIFTSYYFLMIFQQKLAFIIFPKFSLYHVVTKIEISGKNTYSKNNLYLPKEIEKLDGFYWNSNFSSHDVAMPNYQLSK